MRELHICPSFGDAHCDCLPADWTVLLGCKNCTRVLRGWLQLIPRPSDETCISGQFQVKRTAIWFNFIVMGTEHCLLQAMTTVPQTINNDIHLLEMKTRCPPPPFLMREISAIVLLYLLWNKNRRDGTLCITQKSKTGHFFCHHPNTEILRPWFPLSGPQVKRTYYTPVSLLVRVVENPLEIQLFLVPSSSQNFWENERQRQRHKEGTYMRGGREGRQSQGGERYVYFFVWVYTYKKNTGLRFLTKYKILMGDDGAER